ncbi:hypothetical protein BKA65DRAFT_479930 [Rhexocercosporidium sp. MPI-PUGE-AT-0058]|nr:hypothetical protein BKA65DRAFT_479930 [Rhexocercosporidium sp. MPI-PUGE-AT-0058]
MVIHESEDDVMADENMLGSVLDENLLNLGNQQSAMFVSDALAVTSPRTTNRSRSITPKKRIPVDNLGSVTEGTPDISPERSPLREQSWYALHQELAEKERDEVSCHESGSQPSTRLPNDPLSSTFSEDRTPACDQPRLGSNRECGLDILADRGDDENFGQFMFVDETGNFRFVKTEPGPAAVLSGMASISKQIHPSLLTACSPRSDLALTPSSKTASDSRDDIVLSPTLSDPIRSEIAVSSQPVTEDPSSPPSPSRDFDKLLSHYGNGGSEKDIVTSPKEMLPPNSQLSIMSTKARVRVEKRVAVLAEAAEWEEIRSRESKSKSRTRSPQASTVPQGGNMPPMATSTNVSVSNEVMESTTGNTDSAACFTFASSLDSNDIAHLTTQVSRPKLRVLPRSEKPQTTTLPAHTRNSVPKVPSEVLLWRPRVFRSSTRVTLAREGSASTPDSKTPAKRTPQIPRLVPNLTKLFSFMVSIVRTSTPSSVPNPKSYNSPYTAPTMSRLEACGKSAHSSGKEIGTVALRALQPTTILPPGVKAVHARKASDDASAPAVPVVPKPASEAPILSPSSGHASTLPSISLSPSSVDCVLSVLAGLQKPQVVSDPTRISAVPSLDDSLIDMRNMSPPNPTISSADINTSISETAPRIVAAQKTEGVEHMTRDESSTAGESDEQEAIAIETSRFTIDDRPPPRLGPYAHVPESGPFSAKPSYEEIAAIQALELQNGFGNNIRPPVNEELQ